MTTLQELIESEICDFFAGFGSPGEPETPEEMQSQLLSRVMPLLAGMGKEPVGYYREATDGDGYYLASTKGPRPGTIPLYAAPQLPLPAVVIPLGVTWEDVPEEITEDDMGLASAWAHGFNQCRAAMIQGAGPAKEHDGWKMGPLIAFPSQWAAGQKAFESAGMNKVDAVYKAMVAAAPQQEIK